MTSQPSDSLRILANRLGVAPPPTIDDGVDWALEMSLRDRGVNVLLKLDGDRAGDSATVVLSGPCSKETSFGAMAQHSV